MKREIAEAKDQCKGSLPSDEWLLKNCPAVLEHLCDGRFDDGTPRETSTISIFVDAGVLKVSLNDREQRRTLYVTASNLQDGFLGLEKSLGATVPDWRPWKDRKKK